MSRGRVYTGISILFILLLLLQGCSKSGFLNSKESLIWQLPEDFAAVQKDSTGWKGITGEYTFRTIYMRKPDTSAFWKIKAESLQLPIAITNTGAFQWNPQSVMNWLKADAEKTQCSTDGWRIIDEDEKSMLYEWEDIACSAVPTKHELVRIVLGKWYVWIISFGCRDANWSDPGKEAFIANLRAATIGPRGTDRQ